MARKAVLLRIDAGLWEALRRWADDELRSVNGQVEFVLREAVRKRTGKTHGSANLPEGREGADSR